MAVLSELWSLLLYGLHVPTRVSFARKDHHLPSKLNNLGGVISSNMSTNLEPFVPDVLVASVTDKLCVDGEKKETQVRCRAKLEQLLDFPKLSSENN